MIRHERSHPSPLLKHGEIDYTLIETDPAQLQIAQRVVRQLIEEIRPEVLEMSEPTIQRLQVFTSVSRFVTFAEETSGSSLSLLDRSLIFFKFLGASGYHEILTIQDEAVPCILVPTQDDSVLLHELDHTHNYFVKHSLKVKLIQIIA